MKASVLFRPLLELLEDWRAEAEYQRDRYRDEERARMIEVMVSDLQSVLAALPDMTVTYDEAAAISAWSRGTIANRVAAEELENVGTRSEPSVRVRDLKLDGSKILLVGTAADRA